MYPKSWAPHFKLWNVDVFCYRPHTATTLAHCAMFVVLLFVKLCDDWLKKEFHHQHHLNHHSRPMYSKKLYCNICTFLSIYFFISNGILILADCSIFYNSNENNHLFGLFQMVNKMKFSLNYRSSTELLYCTLTVNYWSLFRNMRLYDPLPYFFS